MQKRIKHQRHGMYGTRPYNIWSGIKRRCYNKNEISYKRYGEKGITMCDEWKNSFMSFWVDMKEGYFDSAQIDRIDNTKGYYKENCRWVTIKEQANNKKCVIKIEFNGIKKTYREWDELLGLKHGSVRNRLLVLKWDKERALTERRKKPKHFFKDERGLYRVEKSVNGKNVYIGRFKSEKKARMAIKKFLNSN